MTATTFRYDTATGILVPLNTVATAHPTLLRRVYRARPENLTVDMPAAFIDYRPETVTHDSGTRIRTMTPSVVVIRKPTDNAEAMADFDVLVDYLVDAFTAVPQFAPGTMWDTYTVGDEEYPFAEALYPAVRFTFSDVTIMEGRT